jgi:hypothetical protein
MGHSHSLPKGHPMNALAIQVAFTLPLTLPLPLVIGIAVLRPAWFYPALMITLGAHYLPFVFLYGMWQFGVLSATLIASGLAIAMSAKPCGHWSVAHSSPPLRIRLCRSSRCAQTVPHLDVQRISPGKR